MWLYHSSGGNGLKLTDRRNWEQNATEPTFSPDGRYLLFSEDVSPGGGFQYNRDPYTGVYVVQRLDRQTGQRRTWINGAGGSIRPQVSPDGKSVAFIRRIDGKSVLMLSDVESGRERVLWDGLDRDQQEAWAIYGTYQGYAFTPDGQRIIISAQGSSGVSTRRRPRRADSFLGPCDTSDHGRGALPAGGRAGFVRRENAALGQRFT